MLHACSRTARRSPRQRHPRRYVLHTQEQATRESHIADKYKNQGYRDLFGPGTLERASIEQWLQTEAQSFDIPSADMVYSLAYLYCPTCSSMAGAQLGKLLDIYEQRLGEEAFLAGGKFTLADLSHLPNADRLAGDPQSACLIESRRNVSKWWDTVSRRDS
ncbi:Glutathione S-transferase F9 [Zea mays]|uniref:glutathione transferase n=1 Tax=Zea mays TaxID=4577 RepID=A0A1D6K7T4_MAIZE|nr:Glutathione S-transferase F9 [Zea mays]